VSPFATALHASQTRLKLNERRREATDQRYLDQLARRFADDTGLPLPLARKRVQALAISAKPRPFIGGFQDRG